MPAPKKKYPVYILTEDGQIKDATYDPHKADNWIGLGETYDYVVVVPDNYTPAEDRVPSMKENVTTEHQQIRDTIGEAEKVLKRFEPKSSLLR